MVGFGLSSAAKPVSIIFTAERTVALTASADEQRYALHTIHRHVFFVAGTVPVPPLGVCQLVQRALSLAAHKMH